MPLPLLLFIFIPAIEIVVLIQVGGLLGATTTLLLILATAFIGYRLLRIQGFDTLWRGQQKLARGELPAQELIEGVLLAFCGALLLTPGFITDLIGFAGLVPVWRRALGRRLLARSASMSFHSRRHGADVYEGEYSEQRDRLQR